MLSLSMRTGVSMRTKNAVASPEPRRAPSATLGHRTFIFDLDLSKFLQFTRPASGQNRRLNVQFPRRGRRTRGRASQTASAAPGVAALPGAFFLGNAPGPPSLSILEGEHRIVQLKCRSSRTPRRRFRHSAQRVLKEPTRNAAEEDPAGEGGPAGSWGSAHARRGGGAGVAPGAAAAAAAAAEAEAGRELQRGLRVRGWGGRRGPGRGADTWSQTAVHDFATQRRRCCGGARARAPAAPRTAGRQGAGAAGPEAPDDGFGCASVKRCHMSLLAQGQTCPDSCRLRGRGRGAGASGDSGVV
ncbi:hypothetical protein R6Z07M_004432 [Ovis aries]